MARIVLGCIVMGTGPRELAAGEVIIHVVPPVRPSATRTTKTSANELEFNFVGGVMLLMVQGRNN